MHLTNSFKNELKPCLENNLIILHVYVLSYCCNCRKCTKCETIAKLHRFDSLFISSGCISIIQDHRSISTNL